MTEILAYDHHKKTVVPSMHASPSHALAALMCAAAKFVGGIWKYDHVIHYMYVL